MKRRKKISVVQATALFAGSEENYGLRREHAVYAFYALHADRRLSAVYNDPQGDPRRVR